MWQSHRPGINVLPRPSITCAPAGTATDARAPTAVIAPLSTTTVWSVRNRVASASKSRTPVNATGPAGTVTRALTNPGACAAIALACASSMFCCSPAYASGSQASPKRQREELVVRVRPDRQRRGADAGDRPERDGLSCRAGADLEIGQLGGARLAAGQEVERLVGPRQQRLEEPRRGVDRSALRHVERGGRIARGAGVDWALPACRPAADREGLGRVALRRHAADRDAPMAGRRLPPCRSSRARTPDRAGSCSRGPCACRRPRPSSRSRRACRRSTG